VGYVPGFPGAHSQGATLEELHANLQEVIAMLVDDGEPKLETEFSGTQTVRDGAFAVPIARPSKRYLQYREWTEEPTSKRAYTGASAVLVPILGTW